MLRERRRRRPCHRRRCRRGGGGRAPRLADERVDRRRRGGGEQEPVGRGPLLVLALAIVAAPLLHFVAAVDAAAQVLVDDLGEVVQELVKVLEGKSTDLRISVRANLGKARIVLILILDRSLAIAGKEAIQCFCQ